MIKNGAHGRSRTGTVRKNRGILSSSAIYELFQKTPPFPRKIASENTENAEKNVASRNAKLGTLHLVACLLLPVYGRAASLNATASVEIVKSSVDVQYVQKMHQVELSKNPVQLNEPSRNPEQLQNPQQFVGNSDMVIAPEKPAGDHSAGMRTMVIDPDNSYHVVEQPWGVEVVYE